MKDGNNPLIILAAGGTGGHVFPAQALAEEMLNRGWRVALWTDRRGLRFVGSFPNDAEIKEIQTATFAQGGILEKFTAPFKVLFGTVLSFFGLKRKQAAVVAGFGGYPAFPPVAAAWAAGLPSLIHEQNGVLGKANRLLAPRVNLVVCGALDTILPPGIHSRYTGNPVRTDILAFSETEYHWPDAGPVNILVLGGSQGARIMDHVVPAALSRLPVAARRRLRVVQQVRDSHNVAVGRFYEEVGIQCEIATFFEDVPRRMAEAQIVIGRAGASTVAEIAVIGRPAILIPYAAAANDHQSANAAGLERAGAAIAIREDSAVTERLAAEVGALLDNPDRAKEMALATKKIARPQAASMLADVVESLAQKGRQSSGS